MCEVRLEGGKSARTQHSNSSSRWRKDRMVGAEMERILRWLYRYQIWMTWRVKSPVISLTSTWPCFCTPWCCKFPLGQRGRSGCECTVKCECVICAALYKCVALWWWMSLSFSVCGSQSRSRRWNCNTFHLEQIQLIESLLTNSL